MALIDTLGQDETRPKIDQASPEIKRPAFPARGPPDGAILYRRAFRSAGSMAPTRCLGVLGEGLLDGLTNHLVNDLDDLPRSRID